MKIQARFVIEPRRNNDVLDNYYNYLSHLFNTHDDFTEDTRANFSFRNYLQSPLQPGGGPMWLFPNEQDLLFRFRNLQEKILTLTL